MERSLIQKIAVLGSTGSIGMQTLDIVRNWPDLFGVNTLTACNNWELLARQAIEFQPDSVVIAEKRYYAPLKEALAPYPIKIYAGKDALEQVVDSNNVDTVVMALVGYSGLLPTVRAVECGKKIALANKECLVAAGEIIMRLSEKHSSPIIPVDSEHSAIFQCLAGERSRIEKVILTASGGPFLNKGLHEMDAVTVAEALSHPSWNMGDKITIDSATMMNKGFEVIEAKWLFGLEPSQIEVVVHPGSIVHSMVQFSDGAVKAQLGIPDMKLPIQYALTFPFRMDMRGERLDFCKLGTLEFHCPDHNKFPNLALAYDVMARGGNSGAVLNAANEVAVRAFLDGRIKFTDIARLNENALTKARFVEKPNLAQLSESDSEAREITNEIIGYRDWFSTEKIAHIG